MLSHLLAAGLLAVAAVMLVGPHHRGLVRRSRAVASGRGAHIAGHRGSPAPVGGWLSPAAPRLSRSDPVGLAVRWWRGDSIAPRYSGALRVVGALAPLVVGFLVAGPVAAVLAVVATVGAGRAVLRARDRHRRAVEEAAAAEAVAALAAELRAGRHPAEALLLAAGAAPEVPGLRAGAAAASWGGDIPTALRWRPTGGGAPWLHALAGAWSVADASGAGLADVLGSVEAELRSTIVLGAETDAELAASRATARVLALLPLLGIALGAGLGSHPVHVLLHTPLGAACTGAGLVFECAGLAWAARLTESAAHGPPIR